MSQSYFRFNNKFYKQPDGLAMGIPLSSILSEVFLQYHEETIIQKLKKDHDILCYIRYVDDILVVFNEKKTKEMENMLQIFNLHHRKLKFTAEYENEQSINYLDLNITRIRDHIKYKIFRKPTQTDTVIGNSSNHPTSQKTASFRSMLYRAFKIPLNNKDRKDEINIIKQIAKSNGYSHSIIDEIATSVQRKIKQQERLKEITTLQPEHDKIADKYVIFNFTGAESQIIANRFRKYAKVAFKTNNNLSKHLAVKIENEDTFEKSGIYKISCDDCEQFYIGQTINFNQRFKSHTSAWKNNKPERSNLAKHLINNDHTIEKINKNMKILKYCKKGKNMSAWEELFIYEARIKNQHKFINEQVNFESETVYSNTVKLKI